MSAFARRQSPVDILLVEDSATDVELTDEALAAARIETALHVVPDGEAALAYLRAEAPYEAAARPDLILLDLNLPRKDGLEVLRELQRDRSLASIPVLVLSTSGDDGDIADAYASGANAYVRKPVHFCDFLAAVRAIEAFWLMVATLPARPAGPAAAGR